MVAGQIGRMLQPGARKAGRNPILPLSRGTISARSARLGTVWTTPAIASASSASRGRRTAATPSGRLNARPTAIAAVDSSMCPPR